MSKAHDLSLKIKGDIEKNKTKELKIHTLKSFTERQEKTETHEEKLLSTAFLDKLKF